MARLSVRADRPEPVAASTSGLNGADKFDYWHDVISRVVVGLECVSVDGPFDASISGIAADGISVVRIVGSPQHVARSPAASGADSIVTNFVVSGRMKVEQDGRDCVLLPGDGAICEAERSYTLNFDEPFEIVTVKIPRSLLERRRSLQQVTALAFARAGHLGPLIFGFVDTMSRQITQMSPATTAKVSRHFADLLTTTLDEYKDDITPSPYRSVVLSRCKNYVEQNLSNEALSANLVAARFGLTARYINKLFETEGLTLTRYMWTRRLERAADDLADPKLASHSITEIAMNRGFNDLSHFSRAFRQRFVLSPRDYRMNASVIPVHLQPVHFSEVS